MPNCQRSHNIKIREAPTQVYCETTQPIQYPPKSEEPQHKFTRGAPTQVHNLLIKKCLKRSHCLSHLIVLFQFLFRVVALASSLVEFWNKNSHTCIRRFGFREDYQDNRDKDVSESFTCIFTLDFAV